MDTTTRAPDTTTPRRNGFARSRCPMRGAAAVPTGRQGGTAARRHAQQGIRHATTDMWAACANRASYTETEAAASHAQIMATRVTRGGPGATVSWPSPTRGPRGPSTGTAARRHAIPAPHARDTRHVPCAGGAPSGAPRLHSRVSVPPRGIVLGPGGGGGPTGLPADAPRRGGEWRGGGRAGRVHYLRTRQL